MKQLLLDIRTRLRSQITYVEASAVHILIHEDLLPKTSRLPAIGIKDDAVGYEPESQRRQSRSLQVKLIAYVSIPRADMPEAPILGEGSRKGVLDMVEDIQVALNGWKLGLGYYLSRPVREEPSTPMGEEEEGHGGEPVVRLWVQRKAIIFEFKRQEAIS